MTPYDLRTFSRTMAVALACALLAWAVLWTTEMSGGEAARVARLIALAPLFACVGALIASYHARSQGETMALACLGVRPSRANAGVVTAVVVIAIASTVVLLLPRTDLSSLFPQVVEPSWRYDGVRWVSDTAGVSLGSDGRIVWEAAPPPRAVTRWPREMVALGVGGTVIALAWFALTAGVRWWSATIVAAALVGQIASYHAVAAGRLNGVVLLAPPILLIIASAAKALARR